jgi:hypothetical protein
MPFIPLFHILFWIAMTTGHHDMSQITINGPFEYGAWTWKKQESGWIDSIDQSIWTIDGKTVTETDRWGEKTDKKDVSEFVKGIKEQDWSKSASLDLGPTTTLTKMGDTFVYTRHKGEPAEERFVFEFK